MVANEVVPFKEFDKRNGEDSYVYYCRCGGVFEVLLRTRFFTDRFTKKRYRNGLI